MSDPEVSRRIRSFLENEFPHQGGELLDSTDLLNDWFLDSFGIVLLVMHLEKTFEIDIAQVDVSAENFHSIETLTAFVVSKQPPPRD